MLSFWTLLQTPINQAVFVLDGKVIESVPSNAPNTPVRRAGVVGEYRGNLALPMHSSFQMWTRDGSECLKEFYHPKIYAPHAVVEFQGNLLVSSSGLDLFFIMNEEGEVLWEWYGGENGVGVFPKHAFEDDWPVRHNSGKSYQLEGGAHFNSIWMEPGGETFLTSSLKTGKILRITPYQQGFEEVAQVEDHHGIHSPIFVDGIGLVYGKDHGIVVNGRPMHEGFDWVKFIRERPGGFVFTHETGVTFLDMNWGIEHTIPLPRPFQLAYLEGAK